MKKETNGKKAMQPNERRKITGIITGAVMTVGCAVCVGIKVCAGSVALHEALFYAAWAFIAAECLLAAFSVDRSNLKPLRAVCAAAAIVLAAASFIIFKKTY